MGKLASKIVGQAVAWIGKNERDGSHKEIIDIYNSYTPLARGYRMKYTDAWCSCLISALAIKLGYTDIIPTEVGCEKHIQLFKNLGVWIENENRVPNVGDIIFYDWDDSGNGDNTGNSDHVGIVEKVEGNNITIIEGNLNNSVARRILQVNAKYIRGYAAPKYDAETNKVLKSVEEVAKEVLAGKWDNYPRRKELLENEGYDYEEVQAKVNELHRGATVSKKYKTVTSKKGLNIRKNTGTSAEIIGGIAYREEIEVLQENVAFANRHNWDKIKFGNIIGYVANTYLK